MKNLTLKFALALSACLVLLITASAAAMPAGDADGDGVFTLSDILFVLKATTASDLTDEEYYTADVDRDGSISVKDALLTISYYFSGEKPSLCDTNNLKHKNCLWDSLVIGEDDYFTFSYSLYPNIKMNFKIYVPASYSPHKSYALVTFLHGLGGEKTSLSSLGGGTFFTNIKNSKYGEDTIYLVPQCPLGMSWPDDKDTLEVAYRLIMFLDKHINIDNDRLYISGHSNGSKGVAYMLMAHPNTFAAAVMGSGASSLSLYTDLENIATTPIWMFIGTADTSPGFLANVRNLYSALDQMGADVKLTEFEGLGHNIFSTVGNTEGLVDWVYSKTLE